MILQGKVQFGARTNRHRIFPSINAPFYRDNYDLCLVAEKKGEISWKSFYKPFSEETENRKTLVKKSNFYYFPKTSLLVT